MKKKRKKKSKLRYTLMMSRNSENNYRSSNNTVNKYSSNEHIQSDLYVPSLMHKNYDYQGNKKIENNICNGSGEIFYLKNFGDNFCKFNSNEKLCENCGFHQYKGLNSCDLCGCFNETSTPSYKYENIYENICEECGLIYSADKCEHCAKKVTYGSLGKNKQSNIFSGLFDNIRLKTKSKVKPQKRKLPTIEIVHNVDAVFKTNKTFDLNEICRLKSSYSSENHTYGKLRKSEECLSSTFKHQPTDLRSFRSDSNFSHLKPHQNLLSPNNSHTIKSDNSPIYENLKTFFIYSTISPAFDDITDNSLTNWLTSLKRHTDDYNDENIYNVKSIPSNSFNSCSNYRPFNGASINESEFNLNKVEDFKINLMENKSKRKAIYFKEEKQFEPILVVIKDNNYMSESSHQQNHATESSAAHNDQQHVNEVFPTVKYSFLRPKNFQFQSALIDIIDEKPFTQQMLQSVESTATALLPYYIPTKSKKRKTTNAKLLSLNRLIISIALNPLVITYDCDFITFLNKISKNRKNIKKYITAGSATTTVVDQIKYEKSKLSDFEKPNSRGGEIVKKEIKDFELKFNATSQCQRRLEDFEKFKPSNQLRKQLSDFELKQNEKSATTVHRSSIAITNTMNNTPSSVTDTGSEDIYQPIWKFQTIGYAKENYLPEISDVCYESQSDGNDGDIGEWEVDDEFAFSTKLCTDDSSNKNVNNIQDQYQRVCILYNVDDQKLNRLIYENDHEFGYNDYKTKSAQLTPIVEEDGLCFEPKSYSSQSGLFPMPSPVQAWKIMLWNVNYIEDEEDLNIPESFFLDKVAKENERDTEGHVASAPIDISKKNFGESSPIITPTRKEIGFLDKFQFGKMDLAKNFSFDSKEEGVHCVSYKKNSELIEIMEAKKIPGHLVYGVSIEEVEKDERHPNVPKFVVECIELIENEENLITNGIYRASGKKESIDKIKKKMNEAKPKKGSKYASLKDEDVHTITGALKQFFREMKTDLIPIDIFRNLPSNLETDESLKIIAKEINGINSDSKSTLKYLLHHLVKVDANSQHNLMTASNLSIVWGACLFTSSVTFNDTFETSELIRKNNFIKILIQRYNKIFLSDNGAQI